MARGSAPLSYSCAISPSLILISATMTGLLLRLCRRCTFRCHCIAVDCHHPHAVHRYHCHRISVAPSITVAIAPPIAVITIVPSIAVIVVASPLLHVSQLLSRHQLPLHCRCVAVAPSIAVLTTALPPHCPSLSITGAVALLSGRHVAIVTSAVAVAVPATTTTHFC